MINAAITIIYRRKTAFRAVHPSYLFHSTVSPPLSLYLYIPREQRQAKRALIQQLALSLSLSRLTQKFRGSLLQWWPECREREREGGSARFPITCMINFELRSWKDEVKGITTNPRFYIFRYHFYTLPHLYVCNQPRVFGLFFHYLRALIFIPFIHA